MVTRWYKLQNNYLNNIGFYDSVVYKFSINSITRIFIIRMSSAYNVMSDEFSFSCEFDFGQFCNSFHIYFFQISIHCIWIYLCIFKAIWRQLYLLTYKPWIPLIIFYSQTEKMLFKANNWICLRLYRQCTLNLWIPQSKNIIFWNEKIQWIENKIK